MLTKAVIDTKALAALLGTRAVAVNRHRCNPLQSQLLAGLPEPIQNRPRCIWLVADILAWLESRRTFLAAETTPGGVQREGAARPVRGRPRKLRVGMSNPLV